MVWSFAGERSPERGCYDIAEEKREKVEGSEGGVTDREGRGMQCSVDTRTKECSLNSASMCYMWMGSGREKRENSTATCRGGEASAHPYPALHARALYIELLAECLSAVPSKGNARDRV